MSGADFGKFLDVVNDDNVVVGIAHLNIVIVGKRLECDLFLVHCMFDFECKGTHFKQKTVF